ncbi:secretin receptor [Megalopta genalis]|uniref:secretin receptor n=1 Tax=Megalopta genalis TaxID=115081 RepID=UPI003FD207FA
MANVTATVDIFFAKEELKCRQLLSEYNETSANSTEFRHCPPFFDGVLCWPLTRASTIAILPCPPEIDFVYGAESRTTVELNNISIATKICLSNGKWYTNFEGISWSNYSRCDTNAYESYKTFETFETFESFETFVLDKWLPIVRIVSQIGYTVSFATLVIAMIIFSLIRRLRNPRNRLHMHLFASFIMRAFMTLLRDWIIDDGIGLAVDVVYVNGEDAFIKQRNFQILMCKAITSTWQYSIVANYSWILMEGLYLHNLVVLAFCSDSAATNLYIFMGWGLPVFVVAPWIVIRATIEDTLCWTTHNNPSLFLVIRIPIMISILFNFLLFINIVRELFIKLKTSVHLQRKKMQYSRWAKSTLVLVPLFGAHYTLFLGFSYHNDHRVELVWLFCDQFFVSFQGTFVALLYCLLSAEVRSEVKLAWRARWSKKAICYTLCKESRRRRIKRQCRKPTDYEDPTISGSTMRNLFVLQVDKDRTTTTRVF